jgi:hypothetical protein
VEIILVNIEIKFSSSIKDGEFLEKLGEYSILKKTAILSGETRRQLQRCNTTQVSSSSFLVKYSNLTSTSQNLNKYIVNVKYSLCYE